LLTKHVSVDSPLLLAKNMDGSWKVMPRNVDAHDAHDDVLTIAATRLDEIALLREQLARCFVFFLASSRVVELAYSSRVS
jgi:hypothetical protein